MVSPNHQSSNYKVVIIGGGFAGLYAAKELGSAPVQVTLLDKRNFHLFQPLLYQVATGTLSPGDISSPLRAVLSGNQNTQVLLGTATDLRPDEQRVILEDGELAYDALIVATGVSHHYFGKDEWSESAPGLKTVEDALEIRRRIFLAFEAAERETDPDRRRAWLTFVIVGGGPTGVELAGALADLAYNALKNDFRSIDTTETRILLLEGLERVLPPYDPALSAKAADVLRKRGVEVCTGTLVTDIQGDLVVMQSGDRTEQVMARTVLWAAGVKASALGKVLSDRTGVPLDRSGRVIVEPDLSLPGYPNIFVIGDLANFPHQDDGKPLPGIAPVAIQEGQYVAKLIRQKLEGKSLPAFQYSHAGSLAVIGRNAAVVDLGFARFSGLPAWLFWLLVHIYYLIEFDNKLIVLTQWAWNYFTRKGGVRLITGEDMLPTVNEKEITKVS